MNRRPPSGDHPHHRRHDSDRRRDHAAARPRTGPPSQPAEVVRLKDPGHLVTAVAYLLGYQPEPPSLAVVGVNSRRVVLVARIELPDLDDLDTPGDLAGAWEMFAPALDTADADAVAVLGYTDPAWVPALRAYAQAAPLPVVDLLRVHEHRWWSLTCTNPTTCRSPGCRPDGAPVTDPTEIAAPMIAGGSPTPGTRDDLATGLRPGPADLLDAVTERLHAQPTRTRQDLYRAVVEAHDARAAGPDPIPPGQAAVLLTALADVHVRDACLSWADDAAWWTWHDLIHAAPPGHVAPVATLIAVLAYQRGDGVMAAIATDHALSDTPGYRLARLLQTSLHRAIPPEAITALIAEALTAHPLTDTAAHPDGHRLDDHGDESRRTE